MTKPALGVLVGAGLGLLDGLSAWAVPEARVMIASIVIGSTAKGIVSGALSGWLASRWKSLTGGIAAGVGIGFVLSTVAAVPVMSEHPSRYLDIVLPGMLLGAIVGFVTQRYPAERAGGAWERVPGVRAHEMETGSSRPVIKSAAPDVQSRPRDVE